MENLAVFCADVGSIKSGNFGCGVFQDYDILSLAPVAAFC